MLADRRSHTTLPTTDVARLRTFYETTLGFRPFAELQARGVVFERYETPRTVDGIATIGPGRAAWFKDPDGNLLALLEWTDPV
jgi:catechol 2,3-dioxygenase-like lactoylglutathione lyase family enzyme